MHTLFLNEQRCKCGKLLLKGIFFDAALEIKCKRCGLLNKIGHINQSKEDPNNYLLIINDEGIIVNVSFSACRILGYEYKEIVGKKFKEVSTIPEDISKKFYGSDSLLNCENYFQIDTEHVSKAGVTIPVTATLKLYKPDDEKFTLVSVQTREKDNKTDTRGICDNALFVENSCDFYFDIDKNGLGEYVSPSMKEIFGISSVLDLGKNYFDYISDEKRLEIKKIFEYFSSRELPYRILNHPAVDLNGKSVYSNLYFTPNFNGIGRFVGYRVLGWLIKPPTCCK